MHFSFKTSIFHSSLRNWPFFSPSVRLLITRWMAWPGVAWCGSTLFGLAEVFLSVWPGESWQQRFACSAYSTSCVCVCMWLAGLAGVVCSCPNPPPPHPPRDIPLCETMRPNCRLILRIVTDERLKLFYTKVLWIFLESYFISWNLWSH